MSTPPSAWPHALYCNVRRMDVCGWCVRGCGRVEWGGRVGWYAREATRLRRFLSGLSPLQRHPSPPARQPPSLRRQPGGSASFVRQDWT
eukprot:701853-Rhodomonas_salina.5